MPTIIVEGPSIDIEKKRALVRGITETASAVYGLPGHIIHVLIRENPPENVGVAGGLLADRRKESGTDR